MEVKFTYQELIDRCEKLSSFESEGKVDANGQSRYLELHINKVDEQLIKSYIDQARSAMEDTFERMIAEVDEEQIEVEIPEYRPSYPFDEVVSGSNISKYTITYDTTTDYSSLRLVFLASNVNKFAWVRDSQGREAYISDSVVGINYAGDENIERVYIDSSGNKYVRTNGALEAYRLPKTTIDVFQWFIRTDIRWNGHKTFVKHATEAMVSYAMAQWLRGKLDDRAAFYAELYASSLAMATKNLFTKSAPQ